MSQLQAQLGDDVAVTVSKSSGAGVGVYDCQYNAPESAGEHMLSVSVREESIVDAPFVVNVSAGAASGLMCEAYGPGLEAADGFEQAEFTIATFDRFGNRVETGGAAVLATASSTTEKLTVKVEDNGDGTYRCTYTPTGHGEYRIDALVSGKAVKDSPFTVFVTGGADALFSVAEGIGLKEAYQDLASEFSVTTKNVAGEDVSCEPELLDVKVVGKSSKGDQEVPLEVDTSQSGQGIFPCTYKSEKYYGEINIWIKVRGKSIPGSPFRARMKEHPIHQLYELRPFVGIEIQVDAEPGRGVRLLNVRNNSPAFRAGLQIDKDFISFVQGRAIGSNLDFEKQIKAHTPGDQLRFDIMDEDGVARTVTVELGGVGLSPDEVRELRTRAGVIATVWDRSEYKRIAHTAPKRGKGTLSRSDSSGMISSRPILSESTKAKLAKLDRTLRRKIHSKLTAVGATMKPDQLFKLMDQDGSGAVDCDEFITFVRDECKVKAKDVSDNNIKKLFDALDGDSTGSVEVVELCAFMLNRTD
jgi:hypothetical protein